MNTHICCPDCENRADTKVATAAAQRILAGIDCNQSSPLHVCVQPQNITPAQLKQMTLSLMKDISKTKGTELKTNVAAMKILEAEVNMRPPPWSTQQMAHALAARPPARSAKPAQQFPGAIPATPIYVNPGSGNDLHAGGAGRALKTVAAAARAAARTSR